MTEEGKKPSEEKKPENTAPVAEKAPETEQKKEAEPVAEASKTEEVATTPAEEKKEEKVEVEEVKKEDMRPGMTVRLYQKIKEGEKERVQMFEGLVISVSGKNDMERSMTMRKISHGVGVEKIIPLASPTIEKIEVVKKAKVRRAKLYFMRKYGKRLKEIFVKR